MFLHLLRNCAVKYPFSLINELNYMFSSTYHYSTQRICSLWRNVNKRLWRAISPLVALASEETLEWKRTADWLHPDQYTQRNCIFSLQLLLHITKDRNLIGIYFSHPHFMPFKRFMNTWRNMRLLFSSDSFSPLLLYLWCYYRYQTSNRWNDEYYESVKWQWVNKIPKRFLLFPSIE